MSKRIHSRRIKNRRATERRALPILKASWLAPLGLLLASLVQGEPWQQEPSYRFRLLTPSAEGRTGFAVLPPATTGITFTNLLPESRHLTNQVLPNGSGVAAGDVDADGWCDLFFAGLGGGSRLYRNRGNWRFEDITEKAGVACPNLDATGAVLADIDGDGDLDLIVNSIGGGTQVFTNDGHGRFIRTEQRLNSGRGGASLALGDIEGHGQLDLYVANYRLSTLMDAPGTRFSVRNVDGQPRVVSVNGQPITALEWTNRFRFTIERGAGARGRFVSEELGEPDLFSRNDGGGTYAPVSWTDGTFLDEQSRPLTEPPRDWGLSVLIRDFNGDGWPDLYVCNDFQSPDRFWLNDGHGRFQAAPGLTLRQSSYSAMAIDVADLNRDGVDDFLVVEMLSRDHRRRLTQRNLMHADRSSNGDIDGRPQYPRNTLFLNRGDGTYAEIAQYAGLDATEWSWGPIFLDLDLDGFEDLLVPNGFARDNMNADVQDRINQLKAGKKILSAEELQLRRLFPPLAPGCLAFRNLGNLRFQEISQAWGFDTKAISQGACLADLDNDGDLDLVVNRLNDAAGIYRNESAAPRIAVRLNGRTPNTRGIGARITVAGGPVTQSQEIVCGGRYLSSDEPLRSFAAGATTNRLLIDVAWRSGKRSVVTNALPNCLYEIDEAGAVAFAPAPVHRAESVFEDISDRLPHVHQDEMFDDFARQPLLPRRLSQLGPGVCWWDVDGDGWDDLIIGAGQGGALAAFHNNQQGGFQSLQQAPWTNIVHRDQTAIVGWGAVAVLVGGADYEDGSTNCSAVNVYERGSRAITEMIPAWDSSVGPMALADYDGDGALDLFVGGRVKPGQYPAAATSRLFRQQGGKLVLDVTNTLRLAEVGLVSGAVWSDLDNDGWPELVLACEWGPIRVFHNDGRQMREITAELGLADKTGWWNGVTTGDLDGDGRLDIIAANWGGNTKYEAYRTKPLRLYYGDPDGVGSWSILESHFEPAMQAYAPDRMLDSVARSMPFLLDRFSTHQTWAEASVKTILAERENRTRFVEANWLESTAFLNRGNRFEARLLPLEAQLAPAFAVGVADYDGDGHEDLFLSQNFFGVDSETSRYDAGRGLWLQGDGQGGFRAVPGQESGVKVYGEQRGAAVADFDGDGRVDLVVTQNRAATKLFRNITGRPGLRVRLTGPEGNPHGISAVVRLQFGQALGPAREIHGGSGYWSQESVAPVLATPTVPTGVWVRWPGGRVVTNQLPRDAREVEVRTDGFIRLVR
jgi:enediyne biosynthesis protein E4